MILSIILLICSFANADCIDGVGSGCTAQTTSFTAAVKSLSNQALGIVTLTADEQAQQISICANTAPTSWQRAEFWINLARLYARQKSISKATDCVKAAKNCAKIAGNYSGDSQNTDRYKKSVLLILREAERITSTAEVIP